LLLHTSSCGGICGNPRPLGQLLKEKHPPRNPEIPQEAFLKVMENMHAFAGSDEIISNNLIPTWRLIVSQRGAYLHRT
jgi:hypothetical protein